MRNKGFTLIELLAAIILLGLIVGITVPTYNKYTNKTKIKAFKETLVGITRTLELHVASNPTTDFSIESNILELNLEAENLSTIKNGSFYMDSGIIYLVNVYDGKYCGNGTKQNLVIKEGIC